MFNPKNWIWFITDLGQYWSSGTRQFSQTYEGTFSRVSTARELADVLRPYGIKPPVPQAEDVSIERDRRIALGAIVTVGGVTFPVQTRHDTDFRNINGLVSKAIVLTLAGDTTTTIPFRDANDVAQMLNAPALISMGEQVAAHTSGIYAKSWEIKAMSPIPEDFADDDYWE